MLSMMWNLSKARSAVAMLKSLFSSKPGEVVLLRQWSAIAGLGLSQTNPLKGEETRQFLTPNKETIVCVHPTAPADISCTKVFIFPITPS